MIYDGKATEEGELPQADITGLNYLKVMESAMNYVHKARPDCSSTWNIVKLMTPLMRNNQEAIWLISLSATHRALNITEMYIGTATSCVLHPRDIFRQAIMDNAHKIVVVHNHPSGSNNASEEDIVCTRTLNDCGSLLRIPLLDHIIIAQGEFKSLHMEGVI